MRESELLEHIYARSTGLLAAGGWEVVVGPGDDAAVLRSPAGDTLLITVDQLVEGRHFEPGTAIDLIARKAVARSVSDIAAMGGTPSWATATGVLPDGYEQADGLFDRMAHWARHWGCPLIGGDIASHAAADHPLMLTVTVAGTLDPGTANTWIGPHERVLPEEYAPVTRAGARPGDRVFVTGPIGWSFETGHHLGFEPRLRLGQLAAWKPLGVHAMIDVSDGLGRDGARLGRASGVRLVVEATRVPLRRPGGDWREAFGAGEDYELLACADMDAWANSPHPPIGIVRACREGESPGVTIVDPYGTEHDGASLGWDH